MSDLASIIKQKEAVEAETAKTKAHREAVEKEIATTKAEHEKVLKDLAETKKEKASAEASLEAARKQKEEAEKEARVAEEIRKKLEQSLPKDAKAKLNEIIHKEQREFSPQKGLQTETRQRGASRGEGGSFPINQPRK